MFEFLPYFKDKPFLVKIAGLILLIAVSLVIMMVIGVLVAIPFFGVGILESFNSVNDFNNPQTIRFLKYFQVINQIGFFILPAIIYAYLENRNVKSYLNIDKQPGFFRLIIAVFLIVAAIPAINWLVGINEQMHLPVFMKSVEDWMRESEDKTNELTEAFLNVHTISGLLVNIFIIAFLAAVGEEFLFRGVILKLFFEWLKNPHFAVLISSILFSALHMQFFGFLPRTVLGILFGYIYLWTGSLWIPVILHFVFNGITVVAAFLYQKGIISTDIDALGTTNNIYVISASIILTIVFLLIIYKKRRYGTINL
jgi:membrane protease YdiL (CAAX protease family)